MSEEIATEIFEERAAICEFSGLMTREQAEAMAMLESEKYRQACEVRTVLAMPLDERRPFLSAVERKRGKAHADQLRGLVQAEWLRRKSTKGNERLAA